MFSSDVGMDESLRWKTPQSNCFLYGLSPTIRAFDRTVSHIAPTEIPVLLVGERGTGKQEIALELHYRSERKKETFLKFDCRQVSGQLSPPWLSQAGPSKLTRATNGTIFLDEISELASTSQEELLRLLPHDKEATSEASKKPRIISATARSLEDEVRDDRFREELYYTVAGITLLVPALRHRPEDIPGLIELFLQKYGVILHRPVPPLSPSTMDSLLRYTWPGNVRQVESTARKIVELGDERLALNYFPGISVPTGPIVDSVAKPKSQSLKEAVEEVSREIERELIVKALERTHWHRGKAARELQITPLRLRNKMKQFGLFEPATNR